MDRGRTQVLLELLADPEPLVRHRAAWALGEVRDPLAINRLQKVALQDNEVIEVRRQAIRALGETGNKSAIPALLVLLDSDVWQLRSQSSDALGDIGSTDVLPALRRARDDSHPSVRENARKAFRKIENTR